MDRPQLLALIRRHADVPSTYFPAPYVPALAARPRRQTRLGALLERSSTVFASLRITLSQWRGQMIGR